MFKSEKKMGIARQPNPWERKRKQEYYGEMMDDQQEKKESAPADPLREELGGLLMSGDSDEVMSAMLDMMATPEKVAEFRGRLRKARVAKLAGVLSECPGLQELSSEDLKTVLSVPQREVMAVMRSCNDVKFTDDELTEAQALSKVSNVTEEDTLEGINREMTMVGITTGRSSSKAVSPMAYDQELLGD